MRSKIDDYLYDIVRGQFGLQLDLDTTKQIIEKAVQLAEYNYEQM